MLYVNICRTLAVCLCAALCAACGTSQTGPNVEGDVEVGGPWQPYEGSWKAQPQDLPPTPGTPTIAPAGMPTPQSNVRVPSPAADDNLATYGIPDLQRQPAAPTPAPQPGMQQIIQREFPEPTAAPSDAEYRTIQP